MLEAPETSEPSSGSTELSVASGSLDEQIAHAEDREEKVKELVEEHGKDRLINWIYGSCDGLTCYVKKKPSIQQRIQYVLSKNAKPSPIEFAKLFMEINDLEQYCKSGKAAIHACKAAHTEYDKNFNFSALSTREQKEYKEICSPSAKCKVCLRAIADGRVHCSKKCAANACEVCDGPLEITESSRAVRDQVREGDIDRLAGILELRGMKEPPGYQEQLEQYHKACQSKLSVFAACGDCQEKHDAWGVQLKDWDKFGCKPEGWWKLQQARLEELKEKPEKTVLVERKRTCAAGCTGEERAAKRRRDEADEFQAEQKRFRSMFAEPQF